MKIVVLGSTGYLGSKLVKRFVENGHEVLCLKLPTASLDNLSDILERIQLCDIADYRQIVCQKQYQCLINTACRYPRDITDDIEMFGANLFVPLDIFLCSLRSGVKRYFTIGTGLPSDFNAYAMSKKKLTEIMQWYGSHSPFGKIEICNIALENFYGSDEPKNRFIPGLIEKLKKNESVDLTTGEQIRDFICIDDVVNGIAKLLEYPQLPEYMDFPLGTGEGIEVRKMVEYLRDLIGSKSDLKFGAVMKRQNEPDSIADLTKMKMYGISIRYDWQTGLKKMIGETK